MNFTKNALVEVVVESYDDKIPFTAILGHLCGVGEHQQIVRTWKEKFDRTPDNENEREH